MKKRQKLINVRQSMRLSQQAAAEAVGITKKALGACERGQTNPREDTIELLCAYYEMSPQELDLDVVVPTGELETPDEPLPESLPILLHRHVMTKPSSRWYHERKQSGFPPHVEALVHYLTYMRNARKQRKRSRLPERSHPVAHENETAPRFNIMSNPRRQAMQKIVTDATAIFFFSPYALLPKESRERLILAQIHPSYLDKNALDSLSDITASYRKHYHQVPLDTLINYISVHFENIVQYLKDSHPTSVYNRLCALASETAQILGHTFHLIREYALGYAYYTFALKVALDIGDMDLWASGIGRMALLLIAWGKAEKALSLLKGTQDIKIRDTRLEAWLVAVTANTYAKMKNANDCLRLLEQAKSITVSASLDDDIYWTGFTPSRVAGFEGTCFMHLRQPEPAMEALKQALALVDPVLRLHQCVDIADLGKVHAQLGDPTEACKLLGQVLDVITQTRAMSHLQRVYKARAELATWKHSADVQALDDRLRHTVKALKQRTEDS